MNKVVHLKKAKLLQTIYVRPGAKPKPNAGKTAAKPVGSINKALKLIKPGGTIILAPGVYTENVVVSKKANVTIVGAANYGSILAGKGSESIKVALSDNITIQNVWLRAPQGRGMAIMGSSVNVYNIKTDGTQDDGIVAARYQGRSASLNAVSSQFNAVQTGAGLELQGGSSATIDSCTFNGVGTAPNVGNSSNGLVLNSDASVQIVNSQFIGNTHGGLVASDNSRVTAQGCTFASNVKGNGVLLLGSSTADLRNNTFASNGEVVGPTTGLNGLEIFNGFSGSAFISGNNFVNNTGNGIYIGGGINTIQILNNTFDNNFVGITMDTTTGSAVGAVIQGNTIRVPAGSAGGSNVGILAIGRSLTATIGGDGGLGNTLENYTSGTFIYIATGGTGGYPNLTISTNRFIGKDGRPVSQANAIHRE